jgi:hypothetical protein
MIISIYEIQNTGKGLITTLLPENLLNLTPLPTIPSLQDVILIGGSSLTEDIPINVTSLGNLFIRNLDGFGGFIAVSPNQGIGASFPNSSVGICNGFGFTSVSLDFYQNKTIFKDTVSNKGLEYAGNYETNFTDKSLITKQYVDTSNIQKEKTTSFTLNIVDNGYTIFINNGTTPITINVPSGLPNNFCVGFIQEGTGDVTFVGSGTTINNPIGLKSKGQGYQTFLEKKLATETYYLLGNTKV